MHVLGEENIVYVGFGTLWSFTHAQGVLEHTSVTGSRALCVLPPRGGTGFSMNPNKCPRWHRWTGDVSLHCNLSPQPSREPSLSLSLLRARTQGKEGSKRKVLSTSPSEAQTKYFNESHEVLLGCLPEWTSLSFFFFFFFFGGTQGFMLTKQVLYHLSCTSSPLSFLHIHTECDSHRMWSDNQSTVWENQANILWDQQVDTLNFLVKWSWWGVRQSHSLRCQCNKKGINMALEDARA
jgi:hypothetical protein